jgi:heat shock protein HtpX
MAVKKCPKCGFENKAGAHACAICSARLDNSKRGLKTEQKFAHRLNFKDEIVANKRRSILLAVIFMLIVMALGFSIGMASGGPLAEDPFADPLMFFAPGLAYSGIAFAIGLIWTLITLYGGKGIMMRVSGAKLIEKKDHPRLFNVVEEMTIAGGMPMPQIYIINDTAPNAFATGRDPEHAAVAITTGLLEKLNRDQLQGVMAHEMSHVRNYDIRFAMMVGIMVGMVALMSDFFLRSFFWRGRSRSRSNNKGGGGIQLVFMIIAIVLAIIAPFFARLLQMSISRQRELLADASAVELTRNPTGLAEALEIISGDQEVLEVANRATAHLYIVNPIKAFEKRSKALFSTHPPIKQRVSLLRGMGA